MKPALTKAEWAVERWMGNGHEVDIDQGTVPGIRCRSEWGGDGYVTDANAKHALAALCLHNQEYGFTAEDVEFLRECAAEWLSEEYELTSIANRIEALLPPEEK